MKRILLTISILIPFFGFSQLWDFASSNQDWTKKGSGQYSVATFGTTSGNLHLTVTGNNVTTNNFFVLENLVQSIPNPLTYRYLRVKITNNSPVNQIAFRADATNPTGGTKTISLVPNLTTQQEVFIDLTGIIWPGMPPSTSTVAPGSLGSYEIRFQKGSTDTWQTTQYLAIDEMEFLTDIIKNDHTFDSADNWVGESNTSNGTAISFSSGKIIITPTGALNAKIKNDFYSIDASNKYMHIMYKNNSTINNSLRVNYYSNSDNYATQKSLPNQIINTTGSDSELIIDLNSFTDWVGNIRKISLVLTNFDGTIEVPANVNTNTLEIDRIVINNSNSSLSVDSYFQDTFSIYPNPSSNFIDLSSTENIKVINIYDTNGRLVKTINDSFSRIDISEFDSGIYLLKIGFPNNKNLIQKIIKK